MFGVLLHRMTDNGKEFVSKETKFYYNNKKIEHFPTTPYHAQSNRRVERLNSALLTILKTLSTADVGTWPKHLPTVILMSMSRVNNDIISPCSKWFKATN